MNPRRILTLGSVLALCFTGFVFAQEPDPQDEPEAPPVEAVKPTTDASTPAFLKALDLQKAGKWTAAQKALLAVLDKFPDSLHADVIRQRAGDNAYLGCETLHRGGPSERRIDVAVMGDGFTIDGQDQDLQKKWARLCLDVLFSEAAFSEYRDWFNFHFVRLASLEEGVDPSLSAEERKRIEERNRSRSNKRKVDFSTALDCKAAGPQGQVMADPVLVRKWQRVADAEIPGVYDDRLAIAFARFGVLGMGGGGIANVGRPDRSVTVHEFGHAFVGLLDEYANNPARPTGMIIAPNASGVPDPDKVPWAHFLKKKVEGVGVFEGGATYQKGVWRPANGCAMNIAGNQGYCPVCREAAVLRIYSYVSPIDMHAPATDEEIAMNVGGDRVLSVSVMRPQKHALRVSWHVEPIAASAPAPERKESGRTGRDPDPFKEMLRGRRRAGRRGSADRKSYDLPVMGALSNVGRENKSDPKSLPTFEFPLGKLPEGRFRVTVRVWDPTPWVLLDPKHLLEERLTWTITIARPK